LAPPPPVGMTAEAELRESVCTQAELGNEVNGAVAGG
jgi:hypothetical protein